MQVRRDDEEDAKY